MHRSRPEGPRKPAPRPAPPRAPAPRPAPAGYAPPLAARPERRPAPEPTRAPDGTSEIVVGLRATLAFAAVRPSEILEIAYAHHVRSSLDPIVAAAANRGVPCREVDDAAIEKLAGTSHHEGCCLRIRPRRWASPGELAELLVRDRGVAIALDRVRNPYNVGAILRTAAFFGVEAALLGAPAPHPGIAPDAVRVAEGGAEHLILSRTTDLADTLGRLRDRGVQIVGADGASDRSALGFPFARPTVLVLGNERGGLSPRTRSLCDAVVAIPGTGRVESLNVAVAASILVTELVRGRFVG